MYNSSSNIITEKEGFNYLVGYENVFQVSRFLIKATGTAERRDYILTMSDEFLNDNNYRTLVSGVFSPAIMNKFSTYPARQYILADILPQYPRGYVDDQGIQPTDGTTIRRRVTTRTETIDTYDAYGNCIHIVNTFQQVHHYFLGICWGHNEEQFTGQTITAGTSC